MSDSLLSQAEIDALLTQVPSETEETPVVEDLSFQAKEMPQPKKNKPRAANAGMQSHPNLERILDIPLRVSVSLGKTEKPILDVVSLAPGAIVDFDRNVGEPVDITLNGKLIARGEVVVVGEHFGVRISQIITPQQRIENML
ncbi:flagellar motor switch protein FliN [Dethiobacter alkaliphilus]|uniref:Flagellar motor switch protein FliN n=1 Tax=Dethiobacter alkaliphilus AHT 1 TaxID=555088 RepID=C0GJF1_DETAL|nr:flagellar motor switch protein FliN [Dethiobacter alkaliphilus]EEG76498.1 flagellar motor switch protein FliN [Dethiobacter alkaliphilus AHT 1]